MPEVQQPCPNTVQIEAIYTTPGGIAENVYHVQGTGPYTDINALANRLVTAYVGWENSTNRTFHPPTHILSSIRVRDIGQIDGPVVTSPQNIPGTSGGTALPDNVSVPIKWTTSRGGRSFRGRTFHIGLRQTDVTGDALVGTAQANLVTSYNGLRTALNNAGWLGAGDTAGQMVLVRRHYQKAQLVPAQAQPILAATIVSTALATRRTRLAGRHLKR